MQTPKHANQHHSHLKQSCRDNNLQLSYFFSTRRILSLLCRKISLSPSVCQSGTRLDCVGTVVGSSIIVIYINRNRWGPLGRGILTHLYSAGLKFRLAIEDSPFQLKSNYIPGTVQDSAIVTIVNVKIGHYVRYIKLSFPMTYEWHWKIISVITLVKFR